MVVRLLHTESGGSSTLLSSTKIIDIAEISVIIKLSTRGSYSGNTSAFQADAESSILLPRSTRILIYGYRATMIGKLYANV